MVRIVRGEGGQNEEEVVIIVRGEGGQNEAGVVGMVMRGWAE
jgi:hypothetical protein